MHVDVRRYRSLVALVLVSFTAESRALAKLDVVPFDELLKRASLIVTARSTEAAMDGFGRGHAVLAIDRVIRGHYSGDTIRLEWQGREDDNAVREVGRGYLLFLRGGAARYDAAIHGVSYWLLATGPDGQEMVEYRYPTTMVQVPAELISRISPPAGTGDCDLETILLDSIIHSIKATAPADNRLKLPARGRSVGAWRLRARAAA